MPRPSPRIRLRRYRPGDHPQVVALWRRAGIEISPSDQASEIERTRQRDPGLFVLAVQGQEIVGAVLGRFDGRRGWINHLAVDPHLQGRGVGARLLREVVRRLQRLGCPKVNLHVLPSNRRVVRFYERVGFRPAPMLYMERWLTKDGRDRARRPARRRASRSARRSPRTAAPSAS